MLLIKMLTSLRNVLLALILVLPFVSAQAGGVNLGGAGSLSPLVRKLAAEFEKQNPGISINVIHPPMGSSGSIRALAAGKLDIALSARLPKSNEIAVVTPWLRTPLVLASNGGKSAKPLTRADIANIYAGRRTHWDDGRPIRLILRGEQETETQILRGLDRDIDAAVGHALKRSDLLVAENDLEALSMLSRINGSFGTTTLGLLRLEAGPLQAFSIDGKEPGLKTIQTGDYPLLRNYYLLSRVGISAEAEKFLLFLTSAKALKLAASYEYGPFSADNAAR